MKEAKSTFTLTVDSTNAKCPTGEKVGHQYNIEGKIPVLTCEGICIRGEIARLAANMIAKEEPYRRACHGELFSVPQSAMAKWVHDSGKVVMVDGCFLACHGRILNNLISKENIAHFDALSVHKKYNEYFDVDDVPEAERIETARHVADTILAALNDSEHVESVVSACGG